MSHGDNGPHEEDTGRSEKKKISLSNEGCGGENGGLKVREKVMGFPGEVAYCQLQLMSTLILLVKPPTFEAFFFFFLLKDREKWGQAENSCLRPIVSASLGEVPVCANERSERKIIRQP